MKQRKAAVVLQKHRRGQVARAHVRKLRGEKKKKEEEQKTKEEEEKEKTLGEGETEEAEGADTKVKPSEASSLALMGVF